MGIERMEPEEAAARVVETLGLRAANVAFQSPEGIASSIRRAASFLCPTTPRVLVRTVREAMAGMPGVTPDTTTAVATMVDSLVSHGDLLELPVEDDGQIRRQLFLGPPAFVPLQTDLALLVGIRSEGIPLVSDDLLGVIIHEGYVRSIRSSDASSVEELLGHEGLIELRPEQWARAPREAKPDDILDSYLGRLSAAGPGGDLVGVQVLDPDSPVTFYRGRWRLLAPRDEGIFVARRPQAFGADLWCFAEVRGGEIIKILDLPIWSALAQGADEAWRLQAAIDAVAGHPQRLRVRRGSTAALVDSFAPLPSWLRRRLDTTGRMVPHGSGALFSYEIPLGDVADEMSYLSRMMWLAVEEVEEIQNGG
jgi:hypothetical protein